MRGKSEMWIIIAIALVAIGALIFVGAMASADWDFTKLGASKFETNTYALSESFSDISVKVTTADIEFLPSEDGVCRVSCYEKENEKHTVEVKDGKLVISEGRNKKWYENIFNFGSDKISVYLPNEVYSALDIDTSTGDININGGLSFGAVNVSVSTGDVRMSGIVCTGFASSGSTGDVYLSDIRAAGKLAVERSTGDIVIKNLGVSEAELEVTTGRIELADASVSGKILLDVDTGKSTLSNVTCSSFESEGDTGDILLSGVTVNGVLSVKRDTGDVKFEDSDAAEIFVETDTGNVFGTLLTDKIFIVRTDTGRVEVPSSIVGGRCEITTDTGNITISIKH